MKTWFRRHRLALGAALLCVLAGTMLLVSFRGGEGSWGKRSGQAGLAAADAGAGQPAQPPQAGGEPAPVRRAEGDGAPRPLTPGEVFDNPDCRIASSRGTALLLVPGGDGGARFSAVGSEGVLHSGELDFWPRTIDVAKRPDGSLLTAFGDLVRAEPGRPGPDARWPVRIYLDGQPLIEHENMWQFELAGDGSSYYLIEPLAGDTSRLVIHSFDEGTERVHDLGGLSTPSESGEYSYVPYYTQDYSEVHLYPAFDGVGTHYFYPVGGERREPVRVRVPGQTEGSDLTALAATFVSSRLGYVAYWLPGTDGDYLISRVEIERDGSGSGAAHAWGQVLNEMDAVPDAMRLSPDGRLLMLTGLNVVLIDTQTGEFVFKWPLGDEEAQLPRLRGVLGPDAGVEDVGASVGSIQLTNRRLHVGRSYRLDNGFFELREVDVFDLEGIGLDSEPIRRDPYPPPSETPPCSPEALFGRIGERDGRLVFE